MRRKNNNYNKFEPKTLINDQIRARELRVIDENGDNLGVITTTEALKKAKEAGLDLIEISPNAKPPVAKIIDYGKWKYEQAKKAKAVKASSNKTETKEVQIKVGTSDHDVELKAKRASEWLKDGDRVKIELFLRGRTKYIMSEEFFKERLDRVLRLLTVEYRVAEPMRKGPKGFYLIVEKGSTKKKAPAAETPKDPAPKKTTDK